jgi:transcriptional antiterminator RfaH
MSRFRHNRLMLRRHPLPDIIPPMSEQQTKLSPFRDELLWYCVKTKPKQEGIATRLLRAELELEVFCPKIRFKRARSTGVAWVNEAMFPGYLFVRFVYPELYRRIAATSGVAKTLSFGGAPCVVEDSIVEDLRRHVADGETVEISAEIREGEEVKIVEGPFMGVKALVTRVLPARERVAILLSLLGQEREIEVSSKALLPDMRHPLSDG